jgi:L-asparaginase/Glu-tRNA(Gln) amidotransferase subunit D
MIRSKAYPSVPTDRSTDWIRIATEIELNYSLFDAFVILHGTDTMAYTSSALSFLLEDLGKTIVSFHTGHLAS